MLESGIVNMQGHAINRMVFFRGDAALIGVFLRWVPIAWIVLITIIAAFIFYSRPRNP
jgi:hypothetical protein